MRRKPSSPAQGDAWADTQTLGVLTDGRAPRRAAFEAPVTLWDRYRAAPAERSPARDPAQSLSVAFRVLEGDLYLRPVGVNLPVLDL